MSSQRPSVGAQPVSCSKETGVLTLCACDIEALKNIPVPLLGSSGKVGGAATITLKQVASFTQGEGPNQISRENGKRR
jgi:Cu/Ag efflux pump CusA